MIGGFLGAGKTTAIARLARHYTDQGLRVGLVTNDQAYGLVDTENLRAQGFEVGEVPGACFCCKFNDLVETTAQLSASQQPDIIITEPVGSCTDLMATVIHPLQHLHGDRYDLAPLAVLCKPEHGRKILGGGTGGFTPQAAYIFLKQLEEAQVIVLNKVDQLSLLDQTELLSLIQNRYPHKPVLAGSAATGIGFDEIIEHLDKKIPLPTESMQVDYDTYAEGEAALGWLNASVAVSRTPQQGSLWSLDPLVQDLVQQLSNALSQVEMEPGHVKVLASADKHAAIANWVASDVPVELSVPSGAEVLAADLLVNVRVLGDPEQLAALVRQVIDQVASKRQLEAEVSSLQHFRPARPEPTHRYAGPLG